jgi:hypothetical protein
MKMPSTYISLLLFCGLMLLYVYAHHQTRHASPGPAQPLVKENVPVVKRFSPDGKPAIPLYKNNNRYEKELHQARLTGFSFFRDVICNIAPLLKQAR